MARIRTIKPGFYLDEDLCELCSETHLFAAAILNHCDDEGYFKANPKLLNAQIFALRELSGSVTGFIQNLEKINYLYTFTGTDGKQYGRVIKFNKHQSINKPKDSEIKLLEPIPEEDGIDTGQVPLGKEGKGREGKGKEEGGETPARVIPLANGRTFIPDDFKPSDDILVHLERNRLKPLDEMELLHYIATRQKNKSTCENWDKDYFAWVVKQRNVFDKKYPSAQSGSLDDAGEAFING